LKVVLHSPPPTKSVVLFNWLSNSGLIRHELVELYFLQYPLDTVENPLVETASGPRKESSSFGLPDVGASSSFAELRVGDLIVR
jgi:hypothetical protein